MKETREASIPFYRVNCPEDLVWITGNSVDPEFTDNGVLGIPLQPTKLPIIPEMNVELSLIQYFRIKNQTVVVDLSVIENDMN